MQEAFETLLRLLREDILGAETDTELPSGSEERFWQELYRVADRYDLAHIVAHRLEARGITPGGGTADAFSRQQMMALLRYERIRHEYTCCAALLERASIPFLPLKGLRMRALYPEPYLRTSCDMDILVQPERLEEAVALLVQELHYRKDAVCRHDVSLYSVSGVHLELHFTLLEEERVSRAELPLMRIWESTEPVGESHAEPHAPRSAERQMSPELFYYYHLAHMAKHLNAGGCGVRPFLDLALMRERLQMDPETLSALLAEGGLETFARECLALVDSWFYGAPASPLTQQLASYVVGGGIYGTVRNRVATTKKKQSRLRFLLSRVWMPREKLMLLYPRARHWLLVPYYQLRRWLSRIFTGRLSRGLAELRTVRSITEEECREAQELILALGLPPDTGAGEEQSCQQDKNEP